jgi:hypothetical protein
LIRADCAGNSAQRHVNPLAAEEILKTEMHAAVIAPAGLVLEALRSHRQPWVSQALVRRIELQRVGKFKVQMLP